MKKLISLLLFVCLFILGLSACAHTHTEGEWITDEAATCGIDGSRHTVCTVCGETVNTEKIPATGEHTPVTDEKVEPEVGKEGLTEGSHCSVCGEVLVAQETVPALESDTDIGSATLEREGETLSATLPSIKDSFTFSENISVSDLAGYTVYLDEALSNQVNTDTVSLEYGLNTFFVKVTSGPDSAVYTLAVRRLRPVTLTFVTGGGSSVESVTVDEGDTVAAPVSERPGYNFVGWDYDFTTPVTESATVTALWEARSDTLYTVEIYKENLTGGFDKTVENLVGVTDSEVTLTPEAIPHFTYLADGSRLSGRVTADGGLTLKVYYTRNSYTVTATAGKGGSVTGDGSYPYGSEVSLTATADAGYKLLGWYKDGSPVSTEAAYTLTLTGDATVEARFAARDDITYTVEIYKENLTGGFDKTVENLVGVTDSEVTLTPEAIPHFTYLADGSRLSGRVTADGGLTLKVYYTRNSYTVTATAGKGGSVTGDGSYPYGSEVSLTATADAGYKLLGWYKDGSPVSTEAAYTLTLTGDATVEARFAARDDITYTVEIYKENLSGGFDKTSETYTDTLDATVSVTPEAIPHFTYLADGSCLSGTVTADGGLTLKVYYTRNRYTVTTSATDGGSVTAGGSYPYGAEITLTATAETGYEFLGWYVDGSRVLIGTSFTVTVTEDVSIEVRFEKSTTAQYTVEYYYEKADGSGFDKTLEAKHDEIGATVSASTTAKKGFTYNSGRSVVKGTVTEDGSLVLKVYFMRDNKLAYIVNKDDKKGAITFVFDDGYTDTVTRVINTADKYSHIRASFAVIVNQLVTLKVENGEYVKDENGRYVYEENEAACNFWRDIARQDRFEMVCHTYTHTYAGNADNPTDINKPDGNWQAELIGANQVIKDFGNMGVGVVWAGSSPANTEAFKEYIAKCGEFIGNRYTFYQPVNNINKANEILITPESLRTEAGRFGVRAYTLERYSADSSIGKDSTAEEMSESEIGYWKNFIDFAIETGKWGQYCIHNVKDVSYYAAYESGAHYIYENQLDKLFAYANSRADDLWMPTYSEGFVYYIQWSTATVTSSVIDDSKISVNLHHEEEGDVYNMEMTVRVYIPEGWTGLKLNGETLTVKTDDQGKSYVVIDIAPDETVILDKLGGAAIPDTDGDENDGPIVTPPHPFG